MRVEFGFQGGGKVDSRDAYPQFADMWVPPGYHIELLRISEYVFPITPGYLGRVPTLI